MIQTENGYISHRASFISNFDDKSFYFSAKIELMIMMMMEYYRREVVGEVTEVGSKVEKFKVGDKVAVGCLVGCCYSCQNCVNNLENYCQKKIFSYGSKYVDGSITYGGFSDFMVVDEHFVVSIPNGVALDAVAPLLCAGITVYGPLRYFGLDKPGMHLGVVGLGGVGHLAVKFAKALGLKVTVISTSPNKKEEALQHLGADSFVVSTDQDQMKVTTLFFISHHAFQDELKIIYK